MQRKIEIILLCLFVLTIGCQKEELYFDNSEENTSELTNLRLLKSNDLIVNDIIGSRTKCGVLNSKVDYDYPWLLDLDDNKDRVLYCMDSEDNFTDRKIIYVKNGDERFSYIVERAYVYSNENGIVNMKGEFIAVFTGIVTIYTADEVPVYSYFYSNNELIGETNLYEELKSNSSESRLKKRAASDEVILNGGFLLEVDIFGNRNSGGAGSSSSSAAGIWFLQNSGRYTNWSGGWSSHNTNGNYNHGGNNGGTNGSKPKKPVVDNISKYERVHIELAYLKQRGAKELAEIFEKLAFDPDLTVKDRIKLYDAIHKAYLQLQGEYMMAIFSPENLGTVFSLALIPNITRTTQNKIFNLALTTKNKTSHRMVIGLRDALRGKGNFGLGKATRKEAIEMGKAWLGKGYRISSKNSNV